MPKFYISSGSYNRILDRPDPETAALDAFQNMTEVKTLGLLTLVSEQGFNSTADEDIYFTTQHLLDRTGRADEFKRT